MATNTELWEVIKKTQDQNEKLLSILSRSTEIRWDIFRRFLPWVMVLLLELCMAVSNQPWWSGNISDTATAIESNLMTWAGSDAIYGKKMLKGSIVAGYTVTSEMGPRPRPVKTDGTLGSNDHKGVDLSTRVGVPLHMIGTGQGSVSCMTDPGGWGSYAKIEPTGIPFTFITAHMQNCRSGDFWSGEIFGTTGKSGGVDPHLHLEQHQGGKPVQPGEGFAWWLIRGNPPVAIDKASGGVFGEFEFTSKQVGPAKELIGTAYQIGATSERELIAMLMCAMQESSIKNLSGGDRDSKGYFQQRPSQGWDPSTVRSQVDGFFRGKGTNPGFWDLDDGGDLGSVIQLVQKSAHPHEYAKWQNAAAEMVASLK